MIESSARDVSLCDPCRQEVCPLRDDPDARCWADPTRHCHAPLHAATFSELFRGSCGVCSVFAAIRDRASGRRQADRRMSGIVDRLAWEVDSSARTLRHAREELSLVQEVAHALGASRDRTEIARLLLAAVTAGEGFGLNRAFLFLRDGRELAGFDAVGPDDAAEAARVYEHLRDRRLGLEELLRPPGGTGLAERIRRIRFPATDDAGALPQGLSAGTPRIHRMEEDGPLDGIPEAAPVSLLVPLPGEEGPVGLLVADNLYTGRDPDEEVVRRVAALAAQAAAALERSELQAKLREQALRLRGVYRLLGDAIDDADRDESVASLGELATQVLHGLKNALVVIGGYARWLRDARERDAADGRAIGAILAESQNLESVVGTLLEQAGRCHRPPEALDPADLLRQAVGLERDSFERKGVGLELALDVPLPALRADGDQLLLSVRNVLQNARQATPAGGRVRVAAHRTGDGVRLEVGDSGPGLTGEAKRRACEAFFTTKGGGTGLGLWLVHRVARRHGGRLSLEDAEGGGLLVTIDLPAGEPARPTEIADRG